MTDKEQIDKIYKKIQTKYPDITDKEEIDNLAIKLDKRYTVMKALGFLAGAILCGVVFCLLIGNDTYEMTRFLFLVMTGSGVVECFKTLGKYSEIENRYKPVLKVRYLGELTKDVIFKDCEKTLKKSDYKFSIARLPLCDKEDKTEVGISNNTYHEFYLYFKNPDNEVKMAVKVKNDIYVDAVIGADYYIIITSEDSIAAVYQSTNWTLSSELYEFYINKEEDIGLSDEQNLIDNNVYKPSTIIETKEIKKYTKTIPIISIIGCVLSIFSPIIIGIPIGIVSLILATISLMKKKTKLSIAAVIINVILFFLLIVSVVYAIYNYLF